jgi:hypothetical protein
MCESTEKNARSAAIKVKAKVKVKMEKQEWPMGSKRSSVCAIT